MMGPDDFSIAAEEAERAGACPVGKLPEFYTSHWDFDSLCSGFGCAERVATPEDFGYAGCAAEPVAEAEEEVISGIPF